MRRLTTALAASALVGALGVATALPASADGMPGQSMTHIKTLPGLVPTLESAGVVLYAKGGATSGVIGESITAANGQVVFHVPVTASKGTVKHAGSTLVLFNTANNQLVELRNPVIDLRAGVVRAGVGSGPAATVFVIPNAKALKPKVTVDSATGTRTTSLSGARLSLAPGIADAVVAGLGLPAGALPDGAGFATADVTLQSAR